MTDSGKPANTPNSLSVTPSVFRSEGKGYQQDLLTELKEACQSAVARYVAVHVPHGNMLSLLLEFAARHGLELVEHWLEDDIDGPSDADSDFGDDQ